VRRSGLWQAAASRIRRHLPMNNRSVPAKCSLPETSNGPAIVPGEMASMLPRESNLTSLFRSAAFASTFPSSVMPINSCTTKTAVSAPRDAASANVPATAVRSWYLSVKASPLSASTPSTLWQSSENRSGIRVRGLRAMLCRTYSPAMSPKGSSALASMLTSTFPPGIRPHRTRSALRGSPPHPSKTTARSGSPSSNTMPRVSSRESSSDLSSGGTCGSPSTGNHALASSLALRPSTQWVRPRFGGACSSQSQTECMSFDLRIRSIARSPNAWPAGQTSTGSPGEAAPQHIRLGP